MTNAEIKTMTRNAKAISRARDVFDAETRKLARAYLKAIATAKSGDMDKVATEYAAATAKALGCDNTPAAITLAQLEARGVDPGKAGVTVPADTEDKGTKSTRPAPSKGAVKPAAEPAPEAAPEPDTTKPAAPKPSIEAKGKIRKVAEAISMDNGKHLGDLVGWSLSGTHLKADVEAAATACGILDQLRLPKNTPIACYKKAISLVFNSGRKECRVEDAVVVEDNENRIVHSIVERNLVDDAGNKVSKKDASFTTVTKVGFDRAKYAEGAEPKDCLKLQDPAHPAAVALREAYEELAYTYLTGDVRSAFQFAFRNWHAVPSLPHGGLWFVPAVHAEQVRAWNGFMKMLKQTTVIIPCFDTAETIESLQEATRHGLESQLGELAAQLEQYEAEGWNTIRVNTLEKRVEEFDTLRNRAELFQSILGTLVDDLTAKVDAAAKTVMATLERKKAEEEIKAEEEARAKAEAKAEKDKARAAKKREREAAAKEKEITAGKGRKAAKKTKKTA